MPRRSTKEEFIKKSKLKHGNKYDYSLVEYKNNNTKVTIICYEHGQFIQTPMTHLKSGCSKCAAKRRSGPKFTTKQFVDKSKNIHGNKYDYSKSEYKDSRIKTTIICNDHGEFLQSPNSHLDGQGCPKCNKTYSYDTQTFIEKAKNVHGERYDYSKTEYKNNITKVKIICLDHGLFLQRPHQHLQGQNCPKCAVNSKLDVEEFIQRCKNIHGNRYDYSLVEYINCDTNVTIICDVHGEFNQTPYNHLNSSGCLQCTIIERAIKQRSTTEEFVEKSICVHGNKYNYEYVEYVNNHTNVRIECLVHGIFEQAPYNHLNGQGCPQCAKKCYSKRSNEWIKHIENENNIELQSVMSPEGERRVGRYRADGFHEESNTVYEFHGDFWHGNPKFYDPKDVHPLNKTEYGMLMKKTMHKEMYLRRKGYNYVCIWEHEWKKKNIDC